MQKFIESAGRQFSEFFKSKVIFCALFGVKKHGRLGWRDLPFFFTAGG
jgi:hypothetical protein